MSWSAKPKHPYNFYLYNNDQLSHDFVHAMTAELSWHVQNCDLILWQEFKLEQIEFPQDFDN